MSLYYPKSQIKENLYSNSGLVYKSTGESYTGYYYALSTGKYFTGKTPQDGPNEELIFGQNNNDGSLTYSPEPMFESSDKTPKYYANIPTESDYRLGSFTRYFCKKVNEIIYIEISKETFNKLINKDSKIYWELYAPFQINWKISGDRENVFKVNRDVVEINMSKNKLYQFDNYLKKDYSKFWK